MRVHEFRGFPNPERVRIALAELKMIDEVEFVSVDVPNAEHRQSAFMKLNPSGGVPALELDDGTVISECSAITEYLDGISGSGFLTGNTPKQRAIINMMLRRAETMVLDAAADYVHQATPGLGPEIEGIQCPDWGEKQGALAVKGMRYFDGVLADQPYVAGENFSVADITLFAGLAFVEFAKIEVPPECSNLIEWHQRVSKRPSIAR